MEQEKGSCITRLGSVLFVNFWAAKIEGGKMAHRISRLNCNDR